MKVPPYHTLPYHILHIKDVMGSQKDELQYPLIPHTQVTHTKTASRTRYLKRCDHCNRSWHKYSRLICVTETPLKIHKRYGVLSHIINSIIVLSDRKSKNKPARRTCAPNMTQSNLLSQPGKRESKSNVIFSVSSR